MGTIVPSEDRECTEFQSAPAPLRPRSASTTPRDLTWQLLVYLGYATLWRDTPEGWLIREMLSQCATPREVWAVVEPDRDALLPQLAALVDAGACSSFHVTLDLGRPITLTSGPAGWVASCDLYGPGQGRTRAEAVLRLIEARWKYLDGLNQRAGSGRRSLFTWRWLHETLEEVASWAETP